MSENNKLKGHFVFFGPANVGKSTMIGYIVAHDWNEEYFNLKINRIKEKVGETFQKRRLYSYLVDDHKDEYRKNDGIGISFGTSKYTHIKDLGGFVLIDTPGGNEYKSERYKGISIANIGIFAIEIQQLLELHNAIMNEHVEKYLKTIREFFSSWFLWKKMHGVSNTIILLTKYDLVQSEESYHIALDVLSDIIGEGDIKNVAVIPTSIDIDNRTDSNVYTKLSSEWYKGKTLVQLIKEKNIELKTKPIHYNDKLLMFYNREYPNVQGVGRVIKWKINNGTLNINDKITIAPVIINGTPLKLIASIKSMRNEKKEDVSYANAGELINVVLSNLAYEGKIVAKDDIQITNTSIITSSTNDICMGNIVLGTIEISGCTNDERLVIESVNLNEQVNILWFGKMLSTSIISYEKGANSYILKLKLENENIAMPQDALPKKILLQIKLKSNQDFPKNFEFNVFKIQNH